jgi:hypothetical protein
MGLKYNDISRTFYGKVTYDDIRRVFDMPGKCEKDIKTNIIRNGPNSHSIFFNIIIQSVSEVKRFEATIIFNQLTRQRPRRFNQLQTP